MARHGYLPEYDEGFGHNERERGFMFGEREEARFGSEDSSGDHAGDRTSFAAHPDAHYLSWRDRHMRELDRDYEDYRRERELQFHRDFDAWRQQRRGNPPPLQTGMTQTSTAGDTEGTLELENEAGSPGERGSDPLATATLGTNVSRGRR